MDEMDTQLIDQNLDSDIPSFEPQDLSLVPLRKSGATFDQCFVPK